MKSCRPVAALGTFFRDHSLDDGRWGNGWLLEHQPGDADYLG